MRIGRLIFRTAAISAGLAYGVYKGVKEIGEVREAMRALDLERVSEAATALATITPLSPREVQDRLDAGLTVDDIKQLVSARFGTWGSA